MTVGNSSNTAGPYNTNGATTQFSFSFSVASYAGDAVGEMLEVLLTNNTTGADTTLVYPTDFTVSVNGDQSASPGGSITTAQTYASGYKIRIRLTPTLEQATNLQAQGAYNAETVESQFDHIQRQINYLNERANRAIAVPVGETSAALDRAAQRANMLLGFDADGEPMVSGGSSGDVAVSAAMTPVVQAGTLELAAEALGIMEVWAEWFGASPSATAAVNAAALQAWIDRCAATGKVGRIGPGVFRSNAQIVMKDGARIRGSGSFWHRRTSYAYTDSNPTVIQNDGTLTGTNSCLFRCAATAVGTAGADFSAPGTDDLQDIEVCDIHFDANGADYAAVYYRCGNGGNIQRVTHSNGVVAGFAVWGVYANNSWELGTFDNAGHGYIIGEDTANTSYGSEASCFGFDAHIQSANNGQAGTYAKFHATNDLLGSGGIARLGRGSHIELHSESNTGRACILRTDASGGGPAEFRLAYIEANGDGPYIDYEDTATPMRVICGWIHPGNGTKVTLGPQYGNDATTLYTLTGGAGLTVSQVEVYVSGVRKTPTTDYTVADNGSDLDITFATAPASTEVIFAKANKSATLAPQDITIKANTTDGGGGSGRSEWLTLEDLRAEALNLPGFINSNTYKFFVERSSDNIKYAFRRPEDREAGLNQAGFRNRIINGDMSVAQAGSSATVADDAYTVVDQWYALTQTDTITASQQTDGESGQPTFLRLSQAQASAQRMGAAQIIESLNCRDLRSKECSFQARIRCSSSQVIRYAILEWTGTADSVTSDVVRDWTATEFRANGSTGFFNATTLSVLRTGTLTPSANTWTDMHAATIRFTPGASMNNLIIVIWTEGTAAQNVTLDIGLVQLEEGAQRTNFERVPRSVQLERCQRYFTRVVNGSNNGRLGAAQAIGTTSAVCLIHLPTTMRAAPTLAVSDVAHFSVSGSTGSDVACSNLATTSTQMPNLMALLATIGSASLTAGNASALRCTNASGTLDALARL